MKTIKILLFRNRDLNIILISQLLFQLSLWMGLIGNLQFLQQNVSSHLLQAIFLVSGSVASVFISPLAGKLIDQLEATKILKLVGFLRIVAVCAMFIALFMNSIWWLLVYGVLVGISASFFEPSIQTIIPRITAKEKLVNVNAINLNIVTLARIFGTTLGGVLISVTTLYFLYLMAFIAYVIVFFLTFLFTPETRINASKVELKKRKKVTFREIFPIISKYSTSKAIIVLSFIPLVFISGFNLFVVEISMIQNNDAIKGIIYAFEGTTVILTSLLLEKLFKNKHQLRILIFSVLTIGLVQILLYFSDITFVSIICFCLFGFSYAIFNPVSNTILQMNIPSAFHGRFFSFKMLIDRIVIQVSMLLIGFLLDLIGYYFLMISLGLLSMILVLSLSVILLKNKKTVTKSSSLSK